LEKGWKRVTKFRLRNEALEGRYWEDEEKRTCRLCGGELETWEHLWEKCRIWREGRGGRWQEVYGKILADKEEEKSWIREMEEERRVERV